MSAALIDAARAALNAWEYDSSECRWHMDNLRTALAAAEAQPAQIITAGYVKRLADKMAHAKAACDIPTGDLWRSITQDRYADARQELFDAIDALASGSAAEAQPVGEAGGIEELPQPQLLVESAQGFVEGWTRSQVRSAVNLALLKQRYAAPQPAAQPLTDEQIQVLVLATVYEGDSSTAHRDAWAAEIGIPFARAIERAHAIRSKP